MHLNQCINILLLMKSISIAGNRPISIGTATSIRTSTVYLVAACTGSQQHMPITYSTTHEQNTYWLKKWINIREKNYKSGGLKNTIVHLFS